MKFAHFSVLAIVVVIIAVSIAGCASTGPAAPPAGGTPSGGSTGPAGGSTPAAGSVDTGAGIFGNLNYNFVEYKMSTGTGSQAMTIYMKYDKSGKCTMRFEGEAAAQMPAGMQEMDCSAKGGQASQSDPNKVSSDAKVSCSPLEETVVVPAGTFSATKCTVTSKGTTSSTWIAKGKFMVKMEAITEGGSMSMVLNKYG